MKRAAFALAVLALLARGPEARPAAPAPDVREAAKRVDALLDAWQFQEAASELKALEAAAQGDADRDVRHSAQFAAEAIRPNAR